MHRKLIDHIINNGNNKDMHTLKHLVCKMIDKLKMTDHDMYDEIEYELYKIVYGEHLNEDLAKEWVNKMVHKDGTHGEHWTFKETQQYNESYNEYEWYAIMNMMYSDHYSSKYNISDYVDLAKDWFNDPDVGEYKTLKYYMLVVK